MLKTRTLFFLSLLLLVSCGRDQAERGLTPTAFPPTAVPARITTAAPIPIGLSHLAANPDFFVGATLQLSGAFRRLPRQVCAAETFRSPATWGLEADGYLASAAGMDEQLRALLNEGQPITVEGRWLKFNGPVGCGRDAQEQEVWYLSVDRVLEPNPLVRLPVNPPPAAVQPTTIAEVPPSPTIEQEAPPPIAATEAILPTVTVDLQPTNPAVEPGAAITATAVISGTPTIGGTPPVNATTASTATISAGSSATPAGATPSATAPTPPTGGTGIDQGALDFEDLVIAALGAGTTHSWSLDLAANSAITLTVAPASTANIVLSVLGPDGSVLVNAQNQASIGEVETITNLQIDDPGIYRLQVTTSPTAATDYALMAMDNDSYSFDFRGTLRTNTTRNDTLAPNHDHFWFFNAENGQSLTFAVTPQDNGDPYIELYDPQGARILTVDNTGEGDAETLDSYTLLDSGMFGIRVAEFDFRAMSYQIVLSSP
jgi:hypothetical protein